MTPVLIPHKAVKSGDQSIIPMINIVFLLLIFFMIAGQIKTQLWPQITLPEAVAVSPLTPALINLEIDALGQLRLNQQSVAMQNLVTALTPLLNSNDDSRVSLVADKHLSAVQLNDVLVVVRSLGVVNVALITTPGID